MQSVGQIAVRVPVLGPADSLGKAAEALRTTAAGAVPVAERGQLVGLVTSALLAQFVAEQPGSSATTSVVADLPLRPVVALPEHISPLDALHFFQANSLEHAPVVDAAGSLVGVVSGAALASAVCGRVRPPLIGGMATPFGVYLTGGGVRGGVGDLALASTGAFMGVLHLAAMCLIDALLGSPGWARQLPLLARWIYSSQDNILVLSLVLYAVLFRLSWITGFHAAEHQVVHAIEAGDDLVPDMVRKKPRVHPRCGTNLVAAVILMSIFWYDPNFRQAGPVGPMLLTFFLWRRVGGFLQQYVTTRPASRAQLESGIRAGRELLERYQMPYGKSPNFFGRVWNMGIIQVLIGWILVLFPIWLLQVLNAPLPPFLKWLPIL